MITDDPGITELNREYFNKDTATDVISFAYDPLPGDEDGPTADVIVNIDRAIEEGGRRGDVHRELALYIAHGCDHLTGSDDQTPEDRARMRNRENRWLREAAQQGILRPLMEERRSTEAP